MIGVSTEKMNILLNPEKCLSLVEQAGVEIAILTNLFTGKKPEDPDAVIEVHKDDVLPRVLHDLTPVVIFVGIVGISTSLDEEPHGQTGI
jgi:hypothetical protein